MPKVVRFLRLDGGSASVDLNQCIEYPVMSPPRHQFDRDLEMRAVFHRTPDGQWIAPFHSAIPEAGYAEVTRFEVYSEMCEAGVWPIPDGLLPDAPQDAQSDPRGAATNPSPPSRESTPDPPVDLPDLVTLDQAAARVHRSKRTLERYKTAGGLPAPAVAGGGGRPDLWAWFVIRPWLMKTFNMNLPERISTRRP